VLPCGAIWWKATKVTAGLLENNGSLPPGGWLKVTCGLTVSTPGSALVPMEKRIVTRPSWTGQPIKFCDFVNLTWRWWPSWKSKNHKYLRNECNDCDEILRGDVPRLSRPRQPIKFCDFTNSRWWPIASWKIEKSWYLKKHLEWFQQNFNVMHNSPP